MLKPPFLTNSLFTKTLNYINNKKFKNFGKYINKIGGVKMNMNTNKYLLYVLLAISVVYANISQEIGNNMVLHKNRGETNFTNSETYASINQITSISSPYSMLSYFTFENESAIFVNNPTSNNKIDISLADYTTLYKRGYLKDGRIRVILLPAYESQKDVYEITIDSKEIKKMRNELYSKIFFFDGSVLKTYENLPFILAEIPYQNLSKLAEEKYVARIFLDRKFYVCLNESVPIIKPPDEWGQIEGYFGYEIDGRGIKIAILDTGIDKTHPDLDDLDDDPNTYDPKVIAEKCFTGENHTWDGYGHGTHCASIAAGTGKASNYTYVGVAPQAYLINGKVLNDEGWGYESWIIDGIEWAVSNQSVDIISMSFGADINGDGTDPLSMTVDWLPIKE